MTKKKLMTIESIMIKNMALDIFFHLKTIHFENGYSNSILSVHILLSPNMLRIVCSSTYFKRIIKTEKTLKYNFCTEKYYLFHENRSISLSHV